MADVSKATMNTKATGSGAMNLAVTIPIEEIRARVDNPNSMDEGMYQALVALIRTYGFLEPCLVRPLAEDDQDRETFGLGYEMVQGHHRMKAAAELGFTEIPCIVRELDDNDARALQIGMNRVQGKLDLNTVAVDINRLVTEDAWQIEELTMLGFTQEELDAMLAFANRTTSSAEADLDLAVALPEEGVPKQQTRWVMEIEFRSKEELVACRRAMNSLNRDHGLALYALLGLGGE